RAAIAGSQGGEVVDIAFDIKVVITCAKSNIVLTVTYDKELVVASLEVNHIVAVTLDEDAVHADGAENSQGGVGVDTVNQVITLTVKVQPQIGIKGAGVNQIDVHVEEVEDGQVAVTGDIDSIEAGS